MGGSSDYAYIQTVIHRRTTKYFRSILVATQLNIRHISAIDCFQRYHICSAFTQSECTHVFPGVLRCVIKQVHLVISATFLVGVNDCICDRGVEYNVEVYVVVKTC